MFRKSTHADVKKSSQKISDTKKDIVTRLKHLRIVLDNYDAQEAKSFFEANYSNIYYIFYDNFVNAETDLRARVNKAHREELESILQIFEKILILLPELIHKRWMFNSIGRIMQKLLHPGNALKLRREGMRLFIIWYQELRENASEDCHQIFLNLVPNLCNTEHNSDTLRSMNSNDGLSSIVSAGEVTALLPNIGEKQPDNLTKYFFEALLTFIVSEVVKIEWYNKEMRDHSFVFLFDKFKTSYLRCVLPDFDPMRSVYDPNLELPGVRHLHDILVLEVADHISQCQDSLIRWLSNFSVASRRPEPVVANDKQNEESPELPDQTTTDQADATPGSHSSTLSGSSQVLDKDSADSSICSESDNISEYEIVRSVLFSTRDNVTIVQEVFRQALLLSFKHAHAMKRVVAVYKEWFHESPVALPGHMIPIDPIDDEHRVARNASYLGAVEDLADYSFYQNDVRVGIQKLLQVFVTDVTNVFLLDVAHDEEMLLEQVELCKKVLSIFRRIVMSVKMSQESWEQFLRVLLCITSGVLKPTPPPDRTKTLGGYLAPAIVQNHEQHQMCGEQYQNDIHFTYNIAHAEMGCLRIHNLPHNYEQHQMCEHGMFE